MSKETIELSLPRDKEYTINMHLLITTLATLQTYLPAIVFLLEQNEVDMKNLEEKKCNESFIFKR